MYASSTRRRDEHGFGNAPDNEHPLHPNNYATLHPQSHTPSMTDSQTLYMPIVSPPTPAPSPSPTSQHQGPPYHPQPLSFFDANAHNPLVRRQYLSALIASCTPSELLFVSQTIAPLLKRDFFVDLPVELALYILSFVDEPKTLARASQVSGHWYRLVRDESIWKRMCAVHGFDDWAEAEADWYHLSRERMRGRKEKEKEGPRREQPSQRGREAEGPTTSSTTPSVSRIQVESTKALRSFSFRRYFRDSFVVRTNWHRGGKLLRSHRLPIVGPDTGTVTSLAIDPEWVVIGLANSKIKVYSAKTGVLTRTLVGHDSGVWGVCLVSAGGTRLRGRTAGMPGASAATRMEDGLSSELSDAAHDREGRVPEYASPGKDFADTEHIEREDDVLTLQRLADAGERRRTRRSKKERKEPKPETRDDDAGSGPTELNIEYDRDGTHVMPSELFGHTVIPRAMQVALGLEVDISSASDDSSQEEGGGSGNSSTSQSIWDEDSADHANRKNNGKARSRSPSEMADAENNDEDRPKVQERPFDMSYSSRGWGQPNPIVVSGGCDKVLRVWDAISGQCIYVLHGHTSTIRSLRVLNNRPIAVTGARDATLRVWDVQLGRCLRLLEGHTHSVRCLDVFGNKVVSGSYDNTCRLWNIDTGECIHVLEGHFSQIYCVAFDGERIASGGLDTTVRIWDAETGQCIALLQGHTALVCQLQLSPTILATGGADGRVITFSLLTYAVLHRIAAHDSSVTALQFDSRLLVTGGNDGRVRLFDTQTGVFVRELSEPSEGVWKAAYAGHVCAVMCRRAGKSVVEIWSMGPRRTGEKGRDRQRLEGVLS